MNGPVNVPGASYADLVKVRRELLDLIAGISSSPGVDGADIPDYVTAEAERVAKVVQSRQNANTVTFLACSDIHYSSPDNASPISNAQYLHDGILHMGQAMGIIRQNVHIDFAAMLGDMFRDNGEADQDEILAEVRFVNSCLRDGFSGIPVFRAEGNHDEAYESGIGLSASQVFANIHAWNAGAVFGNREAGYCYRDFNGLKLRVVCLNTSEVSGSSLCLSAEQASWLTGVLDLSEKGEGWRSLILSHHPLDFGRNGGVDPTSVINGAYGLIGVVHGHLHNFKVDTISGTTVKRIAIPNACRDQENGYGVNNGINFGESTKYPKTAGTAEDTSFCVVTIDLADHKIYADHYGAGYDRIIPYGDAELVTFAVSNNLTNVTNSNASASVYEGASYAATLTADDGYSIKSVSVTMGGTDVTSTAYSGGKINIASVTGDIVIAATAEESAGAGYINLVPTAIDPVSGEVFNGTGYMDGAYASGVHYDMDANCVTTGFIKIDEAVKCIYVKGATWDTTNSHARFRLINPSNVGTTSYSQSAYADDSGSAPLAAIFSSIETIGTDYYKFTFADGSKWAGYYYVLSLVGTGANLVITHDAPITDGTDVGGGDSPDDTGGNYTNLVPTSIDPSTGEVYNGVGYKDGKYASGANEGTDSVCVLTGLIPYGEGRTDPIYIKGAAIDTSKSHCRILGFNAAKEAQFQSAQGSALTTYFSIETLGANYYKVTPLGNSTAGGTITAYLRFSLIGTGENLIITINEPIE